MGVVGPYCREGNPAIMTHDMVHRTHLEIFDLQYYPLVFRNWYVDDWMTLVYSNKILGMSRSTRLVGRWTVSHIQVKTRYNKYTEGGVFLRNELLKGRHKILYYLGHNQTRYNTDNTVATTLTTSLPRKPGMTF